MRTGRLGIGAGLGLALLLTVNAGRAQAQGEEAPPPDKPPQAVVPLPGTTGMPGMPGLHSTVPQPNGEAVEGHGPLEGHEGHEGPVDSTTESDSGLYLYADYLLIRARRAALDYVIQSPVLNGSVQGNLSSVIWGTDSGYRLGGGYRLGHGWEIGASYLYFHTTDSRSAVPTPGGALFATLTAPGIDQVNTAAANASLNLNLINLELAKRLDFDGFGLRLSGGLQIADISQKLNAIYSGGTAGANPDLVSNPINFDGIGVRVGGEGWWHAPECWGTWGRGFGLYAKLYGSLLSGEFHTRDLEVAAGGTQVITDVSEKFTRIVPVTEVGLGIGWASQNVVFRVGYELYNFFNLVDNVNFVDSNSFGKIGHRSGDLSLEALVFSFGFFY
jgi:hypothetical protein